MNMKKGNLIVGLDVGTTKTCVVVGEVRHAEEVEARSLHHRIFSSPVEIIGFAETPSEGIKRSMVVNIEKTAESIRDAVKEVEAMTGIDINGVLVGISGEHIYNFSSHGVVAVKEREINQAEINRVIDAAKTVALPVDREVLHVIPTEFLVDGHNGIHDPRGMSGVRLEVNVQIITGSVTAVHNLIKSCQRAGLQVIDVIFEPVASAMAVLTQEEMDIGVGLVDLGGGTTKITLFHDGNLKYASVLNVGGSNFTHDIAIGLRIAASEAERLKKERGCTMLSTGSMADEIELTYHGERPPRKIPRQHLIEVLHPRAEELLLLIREEIIQSGMHGILTSGVVFTGGSSMLNGMDIMAENILELPVRVGNVRIRGNRMDGIHGPAYAACIGLVLYGAKESLACGAYGNGSFLKTIREGMRNIASRIGILKL
jgi:cell division protein FtsA